MDERDEFGKCTKCGDTAKTPHGTCFYCNWKGVTGPGNDLKRSIQKHNKNKDKVK